MLTAGKSLVAQAAVVVVLSALFGGCYTQFATLNYDSQATVKPQPKEETEETIVEVDSAGDTVRTKVVHTTDTVMVRQPIVEKSRQTCFWTRNFYGAPELRCYDNYYDPDYYWYNDYPWWYRYNQTYGNGYCPSYTYYDRFCDCCREYNSPHYGGGGYGGGGYNGGGGGGSGGARQSSSETDTRGANRSYGVPAGSSRLQSAPPAAPKHSVQPQAPLTPPGDPRRVTRDQGMQPSVSPVTPPAGAAPKVERNDPPPVQNYTPRSDTASSPPADKRKLRDGRSW